MTLPHTRALLKAALSGTLANVAFATDPVFGLNVPVKCPGVPDEVLQPRSTWPDPAAYDAKAADLAAQFRKVAASFA
jgi:phosphoenolpyruvate carboxykinase (ATP)